MDFKGDPIHFIFSLRSFVLYFYHPIQMLFLINDYILFKRSVRKHGGIVLNHIFASLSMELWLPLKHFFLPLLTSLNRPRGRIPLNHNHVQSFFHVITIAVSKSEGICLFKIVIALYIDDKLNWIYLSIEPLHNHNPDKLEEGTKVFLHTENGRTLLASFSSVLTKVSLSNLLVVCLLRFRFINLHHHFPYVVCFLELYLNNLSIDISWGQPHP